MMIASPRKGWPPLKMGTLIVAIQFCVSGLLKRSVITVERVENARCCVAIASGLRRGRGCPGWAKVFMSIWPSTSETSTQTSAPAGNARRASASNASRLSSSNAGERDNASASATYLPSSASTPAAIDRAA